MYIKTFSRAYAESLFPAGTLLVCVAGYVLALQSDAFKRADEFATTSSFIQEHLGAVQTVRLQPFGYSIRVSGVRGQAEFSCSLAGSKGKGELDITLVKEVGIWRISEASLDGQPIPTAETEKK